MRKKMFFLLFLILPLLLTACTNPQGGIGPSWDVTAKIPIKKGSEEDRQRYMIYWVKMSIWKKVSG